MGDADIYAPGFGIIYPGFLSNVTRQFRLSIRIRTRNAGDLASYALLYSKDNLFCRTDVAHVFGAGSRGPRVGRGSRLAGPGSDEPGGAGRVAGPAVRPG